MNYFISNQNTILFPLSYIYKNQDKIRYINNKSLFLAQYICDKERNNIRKEECRLEIYTIINIDIVYLVNILKI